MKKLKRPDGELVELYESESTHIFREGELQYHAQTSDGLTGVFYFKHKGGRCTRNYTKKSAPNWLLAMFNEIAELGLD